MALGATTDTSTTLAAAVVVTFHPGNVSTGTGWTGSPAVSRSQVASQEA